MEQAKDQAAARSDDWLATLKLTLVLMAGITAVAYVVFLLKGLWV